VYELNFVDYLDSQHELLRAANLIEWDHLHHQMSNYSTLGRRGLPIRLVVGPQILNIVTIAAMKGQLKNFMKIPIGKAFCGFTYFQRGKIIDPTSLVKFRIRIGTDGMQHVEAVLMQGWQSEGLVKTQRAFVDATAQPKNIAYSTDTDLLNNIREKILNKVKAIKKSVGLKKSFISFSRVSKKI